MKTIHIYRSEPDHLVRFISKELQREESGEEFFLYEDPVDYDQLVKKIFLNDRAICWW